MEDAQRQPHRRRDAAGELVRRITRREGLPDHTIFRIQLRHGRPASAPSPPRHHASVPDRRRQRLHRQGPVGRARRRAPSIDFRGDATKNIIVGNTVLYGATSGEAFFRAASPVSCFASRCACRGPPRSSKAPATTAASIYDRRHRRRARQTGRNFAAGMSGAWPYVGRDGQFAASLQHRRWSPGRCCRRRRGGDHSAGAATAGPRPTDEVLLKKPGRGPPPLDRQRCARANPRPLGRRHARSSSRCSHTNTSALSEAERAAEASLHQRYQLRAMLAALAPPAGSASVTNEENRHGQDHRLSWNTTGSKGLQSAPSASTKTHRVRHRPR